MKINTKIKYGNTGSNVPMSKETTIYLWLFRFIKVLSRRNKKHK